MTPGNFTDHLAMRWLIELLGFPATFEGTFTAGGSTANLLGIGARGSMPGATRDPTVTRRVDGMPEPRVYASVETHHVVGRALGVLGMGRRNLRRSRLTMKARSTCTSSSMPSTRTAPRVARRSPSSARGDVNGGRVDPMAELARIAHERRSGSTWMARTVASASSTRASATGTAMSPRTTRSPRFRTSGWPRRSGPGPRSSR